MKKHLGDTLFRRLFILLWVALVGSHVVAFAVGSLWRDRPEGPGAGVFMGRLPTFPSLPPTPGLDGGPGPGRGPGPHGEGMAGPDHPEPLARHDEMGPVPPLHGLPVRHFPWSLWLLDYGVRLLVIGLAAWLGARWLSGPMHKLAAASRSLSASIGQDRGLVKLDEAEGTAEVRETARVFNEMAGQLSEQFKTRGLLVAALSHDLRTPLTRMRMRLAGLPEDPLVDRCVNDIREMNGLIDSALQLFQSASSTEPLQSTDVCSVVQSLTDDLIEQGQPVTFRGEAAMARSQPTLLNRVVSNLVGNALRYGHRADVVVSVQDEQVSIVVDDAGPGIAPEHLEAVFQPFYRIESSRNRHTGGTGLGLYIARDLIARQGGTLSLSNRLEGGLRAQVLLPLGKPQR